MFLADLILFTLSQLWNLQPVLLYWLLYNMTLWSYYITNGACCVAELSVFYLSSFEESLIH